MVSDSIELLVSAGVERASAARCGVVVSGKASADVSIEMASKTSENGESDTEKRGKQKDE